MQVDKHRQTAAGSYNPTLAGTGQAQTEVSTDLPVDFIFTVRLRSALPVRQALARLKQLDSDSHKLNNKDAASFDTVIKGLLECPACADNYVVTLSSKSANQPGADAVYTAFKGGQLSDIQRYIFIANDRGERRQLIHFVAPLLTPESKELLINLSDKQVNSVSNFKIDVSKLVVNGKVEF